MLASVCMYDVAIYLTRLSMSILGAETKRS